MQLVMKSSVDFVMRKENEASLNAIKTVLNMNEVILNPNEDTLRANQGVLSDLNHTQSDNKQTLRSC
jgi:hypothetical protein